MVTFGSMEIFTFLEINFYLNFFGSQSVFVKSLNEHNHL